MDSHGMPGKHSINVFQPSFAYEEWEAIGKLMIVDWPGKGEKVTEFERAWAKHIGVDPVHIVSVNSCTEGLFQAVQLLGIGPGDEVIIPTIHFVGAAQAVLNMGAKPVFCDVDSCTLNAAAKYIEAKITRKTKAIILNHYGGTPCDMADIRNLLISYDWVKWDWVKIIEDAACAPTSTYNGQAIGTFGDIGVWSFDAMKIISTGDGGMMYIRDKELADKARNQLYLGVTPTGLDGNKDKWWEYEVKIPGARRSIMNDIAAGIGLEQLEKINQFTTKRESIHWKYNEELCTTPIQIPHIYRNFSISKLSYYFYWIQTPQRDELAYYLREQGCYCTFRYWPLHLAYKTDDSLPNAEKAARETLLLPLHCGLSDDDVSYICEKVREFFNE